jgi:hypothetical protein
MAPGENPHEKPVNHTFLADYNRRDVIPRAAVKLPGGIKLFLYLLYIHFLILNQYKGFSRWCARKGLQRKAHRICIGKSEDWERKARFFCPAAGKKMRPDSEF